jgi:Spy/CpxP family protein refolding chaperone
MKIKTLLVGAVFALLATVAKMPAADANPERLAKMAEELKLTPEQREKLKKIHDEYHKTLPGKKEAMLAAKEALKESLRSAATDIDVRKKFEELEKRQSEFGQARFEKILALRAILTPEQRQKFKAYDDRDKPGRE